MSRLALLIIPILLIGCGQSQSDANKSAELQVPVDRTKGGPPPDEASPEHQYAVAITDAIRALGKEKAKSREASHAASEEIKKKGKVSTATLKLLGRQLNEEHLWLQTYSQIIPPAKFKVFHEVLMKGTKEKLDNFDMLIRSMRSNDHEEMLKVLQETMKMQKRQQTELNAVLGGKTVDQFLGLH